MKYMVSGNIYLGVPLWFGRKRTEDFKFLTAKVICEAWKGIQVGLYNLRGKVVLVIGDGSPVRMGTNPWVQSINSGIPILKCQFSNWDLRPVCDLTDLLSLRL